MRTQHRGNKERKSRLKGEREAGARVASSVSQAMIASSMSQAMYRKAVAMGSATPDPWYSGEYDADDGECDSGLPENCLPEVMKCLHSRALKYRPRYVKLDHRYLCDMWYRQGGRCAITDRPMLLNYVTKWHPARVDLDLRYRARGLSHKNVRLTLASVAEVRRLACNIKSHPNCMVWYTHDRSLVHSILIDLASGWARDRSISTMPWLVRVGYTHYDSLVPGTASFNYLSLTPKYTTYKRGKPSSSHWSAYRREITHNHFAQATIDKDVLTICGPSTETRLVISLSDPTDHSSNIAGTLLRLYRSAVGEWGN